MPDKTYIKFLEITSSNSHSVRKYHDLELMFFNKFYDRFHSVDNNDRKLKISPNDFKRQLMWEQYIQSKDDA